MAAKTSPAQRKTMGRVMHEYAHGELKSGPTGKGGKVKSRRQARHRAEGVRRPRSTESKKENKRNLAPSKRKEAGRRTYQQEREGKSHVGARSRVPPPHGKRAVLRDGGIRSYGLRLKSLRRRKTLPPAQKQRRSVMAKFGIGDSVRRLEDPRLLTGGGRYTDDTKLCQPAARAYVLRSPHAHADIKRIDTAAAKKAPGVLLVFTGADVEKEGFGDVPCLVPLDNRDGTPRADTSRPMLAKGRVRHVGDPVALVVAETLEQAKDAAELIEVDYAPRPHTVGTYESAQPGAPLVHDHITNNIVFDWAMGDQAATDAAFAKADKVVTLRIVNQRLIVNSMEPRGAICEYDAEDDRSTLWVSSQGVHMIRPVVADMILKIGSAKLRVRTGDVGGGFGMKIFVHPEYPMVVWASRALKRTVKWIPDRQEAFQSDVQGRDHVSIAEMALDKDCRFLGCRITTYAALGAYLNHFSVFIPTLAGSSMLNGLYKTPAIYVNVKGVMTNTVPTDAYRGAGRPEAAYLIERFVDHIARETGLTPDEIRARNFIKPAPDPVQDGAGRHLRLRRLRDGDAQGHGESRLEGLRRPPRAIRRQGQVARHRHGDLCREMLGRQSRDGQGAVQRRLDAHHLHRQPDQRPGPRDGAEPDRLGAARHRRRAHQDRAGRQRRGARGLHRRQPHHRHQRCGDRGRGRQDHRQGQAGGGQRARSQRRRHRLQGRRLPHRRHRPHA